jgi:hypothetical protein
MLRQAQQERRGAVTGAQEDYKREFALHEQRIAELRNERRKAWSSFRWWTVLGRSFALSVEYRKRPRRPGVAWDDVPTAREGILSAGVEGEQIAAASFRNTLGDEWMMLSGYRNRRGEIDQLLLGPSGLFAIEIKHRNATVYCEGDSWWYERFDHYGNLVGNGPIRDRRGRSPSTQLNEPTDELERFLRSRKYAVSIIRIVLLTHRLSDVGVCNEQTVDLITNSPDRVLKLLADSHAILEEHQVARLEDLILRDHRHHASRKTRPR